MGNKILDYTSIGEKKGKFDALANNIKGDLTKVNVGLSELEKGSISEDALNDFQGQIKSRISELDEISSKFKNYLSYIIESNKDEDSKQASQVAEEVGLMKQKSNSDASSGSSGHSGSSGNSGGSSAPAQVIQSAPSDYESYKKETSDRFQKIVDEQKKVDETQDKTISTLTTDFNKYKTENDKTIEEQKKSIQDVFERLKGHDSRISSLESKTNSLELSKTNTVEVPSASYTPTPTNTEPAPEVKPVEEIKPKEEKIIEEAPIDTKTPMEIDPSKYDQDLSKELGILDPATNNSSLETEPVTDDNTLVKAAAFGALGLGALGLGGGALYYHNKKKDEELNENNNDYLYDDDEF